MSERSIEQVAAEIFDAGDGIHIPRGWVAVVTGLPGIQGAIHAHVVCAHCAVGGGRVGSRRLEWQGDEVTTTSLRDLVVQTIVKCAATRVVDIDGEAADPETHGQHIARLRSDESCSK